MFIEKAANTAIASGTTTAVVTGAAVKYFGMTPTEWSVVGVIGGLVVAILGLCVRTLVDIYYRERHLKLEQKKAGIHLDAE